MTSYVAISSSKMRKQGFQNCKKIRKKFIRIQENQHIYFVERKHDYFMNVFFYNLLIIFLNYCYAKSLFSDKSIQNSN